MTRIITHPAMMILLALFAVTGLAKTTSKPDLQQARIIKTF